MRDPSIHVRKSDLSRVLKSHFGSIPNKALDEIVIELRKVSCDNRAVSITNDKVKKDVSRVLKSNKGDSNMMADIIYSVRIKLKHRGITKLRESDRDWLQLKELTKLVNQFCEEFNLGKREGYIKYIEMAFPRITTMRAYVSKFINLYESICTQYEAVNQLNLDKSPEETKELHDLFVMKVADSTGIQESYLNKPDKMIAFYNAKELCKELGVELEVFIDSQFGALEWCSGIPTPEALYGDKAKERLNKFLYQNKVTAKPKVTKDFWKKLKDKTA